MSSKTASARPGHDRASLYDEITGKIIAELEAGRVPWVQPWGTAAAKAPLAMPKNAATGALTHTLTVQLFYSYAEAGCLEVRSTATPAWQSCGWDRGYALGGAGERGA